MIRKNVIIKMNFSWKIIWILEMKKINTFWKIIYYSDTTYFLYQYFFFLIPTYQKRNIEIIFWLYLEENRKNKRNNDWRHKKGWLSKVDIDWRLKSLKAAWIPRFLKSKDIVFDILNNQCKKVNIDIHFFGSAPLLK